MPVNLNNSGGWQDLGGSTTDGVNSDHGYRGAAMDSMKAVCTTYLGASVVR